ncbi:ABC transporter ATP-binding protein [Miniphocaeibacter halophilus]|uniref:ABC transporter ATP-binding protein n=1 Tax=Miniphocaeibacter halophilus TaxID=2931922 RepID=A0AC61N044_9FIRM|nr:ABC transporter ATP-binding protein [Miniphocaeibacter halophilus]QQK09045.1 ABC transporter ATP-binding protein [Miniphocaeibacter halophilus]
MSLLELKNISRIYASKFSAVSVEALKKITIEVEKGEFVAIMGESGSGKSTLLNIIATLDEPTAGDLYIAGKNISGISKSGISKFRRENIGYIFQDFNLLETLNVQENIELPLVLSNINPDEIEKRSEEVMKKLRILELKNKYPYQISGGEKQRVAIGRAIIINPKILLADEPTGALDSKSSTMVLNNLKEINEQGQTVLMVTHSLIAASKAKRVLFIKDGIIYNQLFKGSRSNEDFYELISYTLTVMNEKEE